MSARKLITLLSLAALLVAGTLFSGAAFTASSSNTGNSLSANSDFQAPTVTMNDPGANLKGTVHLTATATDNLAVASVKIQIAAHQQNSNNDVWQDVCTDTTAASGGDAANTYSCDLDTVNGTPVSTPDGLYDFRAIATDTGTPIANTTTSALVTNRRIDNTQPAVTMNDPGANLKGTVHLTALGTDTNGSGVASVAIQVAAHQADPSTDVWTTVCTDTSAGTNPDPANTYSCDLNTTLPATPDGLYDFRAIATDNAGNSQTSSLVTNRRIDNTLPSATQDDPGSPLRGTILLTGSASDSGSGIASVQFQRKLTSENDTKWVTITGTGCSSTSATGPYSCSFDTTGVADGLYDFRVVATDAAGNVKNSTPVTNRQIDNTPPAASDIQTTNKTGGTNGKPESGDTIIFTYSEQMKTTSILAGWTNGATPQNVTIRIIENGTNDKVQIWDSGNASQLPLGEVQLNQSYVSATTVFAGTMVQGGTGNKNITVTLGAVSGTDSTVTNATKGDMVWTPSATATDLAGNPCSTTAKTEGGGNDIDF